MIMTQENNNKKKKQVYLLVGLLCVDHSVSNNLVTNYTDITHAVQHFDQLDSHF